MSTIALAASTRFGSFPCGTTAAMGTGLMPDVPKVALGCVW
jgi:hypothetical protein